MSFETKPPVAQSGSLLYRRMALAKPRITNPRYSRLPLCAAMLLLFVLNMSPAAPLQLSRQSITFPANAGAHRFVDIDGDGRSDLLVIDPVAKRLLNYHQRQSGFTNSPDQIIQLPPQTAWVAASDVDSNPGLELLMSTATSLVYLRQNAGLFESQRRTLTEASQVFTNTEFPILTSLATNNMGELIPVISSTQTVLYHRDSAYEWIADPPTILNAKQPTWYVRRDPWTIGQNGAHSLRVQQSFRAKPDQDPNQQAENETIQKFLNEGKKSRRRSDPSEIQRLDMDGDGRQDVVLWRLNERIDIRTDIYLFLRGADERLPDQPTQILHCRGLPIPLGNAQEPSPVQDVNGDGIPEIVLLDFKTTLTSPSGLLEMALSRGMDWSLTIRPFRNGAFAGSPEASIPVTTVLPMPDLREWPIRIQGDFNRDGRPDLLVRRSENQWNILFSTTDARWFATEPAMVFDAPAHGYFEITDLNSDGLADIVWEEPDEHRLFIFMWPPRQAR